MLKRLKERSSAQGIFCSVLKRPRWRANGAKSNLCGYYWEKYSLKSDELFVCIQKWLGKQCFHIFSFAKTLLIFYCQLCLIWVPFMHGSIIGRLDLVCHRRYTKTHKTVSFQNKLYQIRQAEIQSLQGPLPEKCPVSSDRYRSLGQKSVSRVFGSFRASFSIWCAAVSNRPSNPDRRISMTSNP